MAPYIDLQQTMRFYERLGFTTHAEEKGDDLYLILECQDLTLTMNQEKELNPFSVMKCWNNRMSGGWLLKARIIKLRFWFIIPQFFEYVILNVKYEIYRIFYGFSFLSLQYVNCMKY